MKMHSLQFLCFVLAAAFLRMDASADVKLMKKLHFYRQTKSIFGSSRKQPAFSAKTQLGTSDDVQGISCYVTNPGYDNPFLQSCDSWATSCISFNLGSGLKGFGDMYACANDDVCSGLQLLCNQVDDSDGTCSVNCCGTDGCNEPSQARKRGSKQFQISNLLKQAALSSMKARFGAFDDLQGISCYVTENGRGEFQKQCDGWANGCISVEWNSGTEGSTGVYACANEAVCYAIQLLCNQFGESNETCSVNCCKTDECNFPYQAKRKVSKQLPFSPFLKQAALSSIKTRFGAFDDVQEISCYVTDDDGGEYLQQCDGWATRCISFDLDSNAEGAGDMYACANDDVCNAVQLLCNQVDESDESCSVNCCGTDGCNAPSQARRRGSKHSLNFQPSAGRSEIRFGLSGASDDNLSCYCTQKDQSIVSLRCPTNGTECGVLSFDVLPSDHVTVYGCAMPKDCDDPTDLCQTIAEQTPEQISNCALTCCSSDNCNQPQK